MKRIFFKKYIIIIFIATLINFTGCYSSHQVSVSNFNEDFSAIDFSKEIFVTTKKGFRLYFLPSNYKIANDTLYGNESNENITEIGVYKRSIPLDDIQYFEQSKIDELNSAALVLTIASIGVLIAGIAMLKSCEFPYNYKE